MRAIHAHCVLSVPIFVAGATMLRVAGSPETAIGRSLVANRPAVTGDELLFLSPDAILSSEHARQHEVMRLPLPLALVFFARRPAAPGCPRFSSPLSHGTTRSSTRRHSYSRYLCYLPTLAPPPAMAILCTGFRSPRTTLVPSGARSICCAPCRARQSCGICRSWPSRGSWPCCRAPMHTASLPACA